MLFLYLLIALTAVAAAIFATPLRRKVWTALALTAAGALWCSARAVGVLAGADSGPVWSVPGTLFGGDTGSMDGLSALFVVIISVGAVAAVLYSRGYLAHCLAEKSPAHISLHYTALVAMFYAMLGVVLSDGGFSFLFFWELMTVASFLLILFDAQRREVRRAALSYLIMMHIGFVLLVIGFVRLDAACGAATFGALGDYFRTQPGLPLLLVFLVGLMIYSLTLNGAAEGVKFLLMPDFSKISSFGDVADIVVKAMGQVFFSLSLGMGTLITYGSYLEKDNDLSRSTWIIVTIDTAIAMISGLTVLPAVFAMGLEPDEGAGLIFSTLTAVFGGLSYGRIAGTVFFALVLFAAITSSISLLETIVSFLTERYGLSRLKATVIPVIIIGLLCVPASLSYGVLSDVRIFGLTVFELFVFLSDQIIMPLGGFFLCILAGRIWGRKNMEREISSDGRYPFRLAGVFDVMIKYP